MKPSTWNRLLERVVQTRRRLLDEPVASVIDRGPLDLRILGRTMLHAAMVGIGAGLLGAAFVAVLVWLEAGVLGGLAGYQPLRASGEHAVASDAPWRPWLFPLLLFAGGVGAGLVTRLAPEARGGGTNATLDAYHAHEGVVRARVLPVRFLASLLTLGTGGSGGREGPTIQMGGALGSLVGRLLGVTPRERRVLLVAGIAAGISAVFRTPLGAALLAAEILTRDDFEAEALIPSVLSSVIAYSIVTVSMPEGALFSHAPRFPFVPGHLWLYALTAVVTAFGAVFFLTLHKATTDRFRRLRAPEWLRPGLGGLLLGLFAWGLLVTVAEPRGLRGIGLLGGGYGLVQSAITGAPWLGITWAAVALLTMLFFAKALATSLTIGSGGSAGDFAPSMAMGGVLGGAVGRAAALLLGDPRLDPGAFVLVGMASFYGGIAHVPLSAMVMVCELAGNYDLLPPLMLAMGISFVLLRRWSLYGAQRSAHPAPESPDARPPD